MVNTSKTVRPQRTSRYALSPTNSLPVGGSDGSTGATPAGRPASPSSSFSSQWCICASNVDGAPELAQCEPPEEYCAPGLGRCVLAHWDSQDENLGHWRIWSEAACKEAGNDPTGDNEWVACDDPETARLTELRECQDFFFGMISPRSVEALESV